MKQDENKKEIKLEVEPIEPTSEPEQQKVTTLRFGHFSLSTPSFWITVICILCMFMIMQIMINIYMYNKIMTRFLDHEERVMETVIQAANR